MATAMSFQPAFHPKGATLRLSDFNQFHDGLTVRAFKRIMTETGFEAFTPGEGVKRSGKRIEVEKGKLARWRWPTLVGRCQ